MLVRYLVLGLRALLTVQRLDLALENVVLRHQLEVLARSRKRAPLRPADRLLWSWLARLWPRWRRHLVFVRPETLVRWHRTAWRRYWTRRVRGDGAVVRVLMRSRHRSSGR